MKITACQLKELLLKIREFELIYQKGNVYYDTENNTIVIQFPLPRADKDYEKGNDL